MKTLYRRMLIWTMAGAAAGVTHAFVATPSIHATTISLLIGSVSGATAGATASIPAPRFLQTILTGAAGGFCIGILSFWLFGSSHSFGRHITSPLAGCIVGILVYRYIT